MATDMIYLDFDIGGGRSNAYVYLNERDLLELYEKTFRGCCAICHKDLSNSSGHICCECLDEEMNKHLNCCLEGKHT